MTDRLEQAIEDTKQIRKLLRSGTYLKFRAVDPAHRKELESSRDELSKEIWKLGQSCQYFKKSIRRINDPDEIREEIRRVQQDIEFPWGYYYGVNIDKEKLRSYTWYLQIKLFDLTRQSQETKYLIGALSVNKPEIIEYHKAERGIDLSSRSAIDVYAPSADPQQAERATNKHLGGGIG